MIKPEKIRKYHELRPAVFMLMSRFEFSTAPALPGFTNRFIIHLRKLTDDWNGVVLVLEFESVRNLKIRRPGIESRIA